MNHSIFKLSTVRGSEKITDGNRVKKNPTEKGRSRRFKVEFTFPFNFLEELLTRDKISSQTGMTCN